MKKGKYLFVSDIHGESPKLAAELSAIAAEKEVPEIVFFLGDVVGTELLDKLQKLFYNGVYNHMKTLLKANNDPTDEEIRNFPIGDGKTIADGCKELWSFLNNLFPTFEPNMAKYARELAKYVHYGHFCSNLSLPIKNIIGHDLEKKATVWIDIMKQFTQKGSFVVFIEGNWDARTPVDFLPIKEECRPIPVKGRSFYFKDFLKSKCNQIQYFDHAGTIATNNEIFVIWPFDCAANATMIPEFEDDETRKIILVSHGQIDWTAIKGNTPMTAEGKAIQENMDMNFRDLKAETAVHGHLHDVINSDGYTYQGKFVHYLPLRTYRFIDFD